MNTLILAQPEMFGTFELNRAGTILSSRPNPSGNLNGSRQALAKQDLVGLNFLNEVASFQNVCEFRQRVDQFAISSNLAETFYFTCHFAESVVQLRAMRCK
jgi:hypothetical protein